MRQVLATFYARLKYLDMLADLMFSQSTTRDYPILKLRKNIFQFCRNKNLFIKNFFRFSPAHTEKLCLKNYQKKIHVLRTYLMTQKTQLNQYPSHTKAEL